MGERSAGNPHAAFDVEGTGDVARHRPKPARQSSTLPKPLSVFRCLLIDRRYNHGCELRLGKRALKISRHQSIASPSLTKIA